MVYNFLLFMVFLIYIVLLKMDNDLINVVYDLGVNNMIVFRKIIFFLSLLGVMFGIIMVFMLVVIIFVILRLLGGGKIMLVGDLIE